MTEDQLRQIEALNGDPDTSDCPEASVEAWATAQRSPFFKPRKNAADGTPDVEVVKPGKRL